MPKFFVLTINPIPPNPAELLGSKKMKNFITEIKEYFDAILFDAPPVLAVTEAQILWVMFLQPMDRQRNKEWLEQRKILIKLVERF